MTHQSNSTSLDPAQVVSDAVQNVSEAVNHAVDQARENIEKGVAQAKTHIGESLDSAKEQLEASKVAFVEKASHTKASLQNTAVQLQEKVHTTAEHAKTATTSVGRRIWRSLLNWIDTSDAAVPAVPIAEDRVNWVRVLPFLGVHLMCLGVFFVGFSWFAVAVALAMYVIRMFAVTGFYHRYFSHKAFKTSRAMQFVMGLWGAACVQRGPLWWAANHRHHHKHSDRPDDFHSPVQHGFWWSHMGWIMGSSAFKTDLKQVPDLAKYPELRWLDRFDMTIPFALGAVMFALGILLERFVPSLGTTGPQLLIWGFFVSTVMLFHGTVTINSLSHVWGSRRYKTKDDSRNNWFLAIITLGEGWHNNHHHYPGSARQGFFWWEYDLTYYGLKAMSWLGLIWDLKPVPAAFKMAHKNPVRP